MRTMTAILAGVGMVAALGQPAASQPTQEATQQAPLEIRAGRLPALGKVDDRFQSYQLSFSHVTGGQTWKSYGAKPSKPPTPEEVEKNPSLLYERRDPADLTNPRLRMLTSALAPLYIRYGGTTANSVYFQNDDAPPLPKAPDGYTVVLTRAAWKRALNFAKAVDAKILTSFTISSGVRDASGVWTPKEAAPWLAYTKSIGGQIYAAELFNEPNYSSFGQGPKNYQPDNFARDFKVYQEFARAAAPEMKLVGPGDSVTINVPQTVLSAEQLMSGNPRPKFDIVSYHFYPGIAPRCTPPGSGIGMTPDKALSEEFLAGADKPFQEHKALRDRLAPGAPIWLTETGAAACGGPPWQPTFLDTFRYADQQGRLAKQGLDVMFSHALIGRNYGLLDEGSYEPRPTYWTAVLWRRLMGSQVLDAGAGAPGVHLYAQCLRGSAGGVTLLAINLRQTPARVSLSGPAQLYALTAPQLQSREVQLNGRTLALAAGDRMPALRPVSVKDSAVELAPASVNFITLPRAQNPHCAD